MSASPYYYRDLVEAVNGLRQRGYDYDFHYEDACLYCEKISEKFKPSDLKIIEYYRFDGISDPEDNSVIYGIESTQGHKGIIIDAYGAYSDEHKAAFISNLKVID